MGDILYKMKIFIQHSFSNDLLFCEEALKFQKNIATKKDYLLFSPPNVGVASMITIEEFIRINLQQCGLLSLFLDGTLNLVL